ncbi:MAG: NERD domain-containing protein [Anaerolineae bacterium]|nr:NERD domain-containing protein [Anaerolineae bacterium]
MRNISPSHTMVNQAHRILVTGMLLILAGLVVLALGLFLHVVPLSLAPWYETLKTGLLIFGVVLALLGGLQLVRSFRVPRDNPQALSMAGFLERFLDYRYTYIRNIGRRELGYVDAVLVGPNGVLVFYFFRKKGAFFQERHVWLERSGETMLPMRENPTQEAVKDVNALRAYLKPRGLGDVPVYAVVVVVDPQTAVTVQQPVVPVAHMHNVQRALYDNYLAAERVRADRVVGVVRAIMDGIA